MIHLAVKYKKVFKAFIIFLLGVLDCFIEDFGDGLFSSGILMLLLTGLLGYATNYILSKFGWNPWAESLKKYETQLLDYQEQKLSEDEIENRKENAILNFAIIWALLICLINLI